jgi:hypothetical protein
MQTSKRLGICRAIVLYLTLITSVMAADISDFSTDGCSLFPDGTAEQQALWQNCCIAHDLHYWAGGNYADREAADEALEACVADVGEPAIAKLMMAGVRAGGSPFFPTTYRWGYGWPFGRGYQSLTDAEKDAVLAAIERSEPSAFIPIHPLHKWLNEQKQKPLSEQ